MEFSRAEHWKNVFETKDTSQVSWFESSPVLSLDLVKKYATSRELPIVDLGGGDSRLVDGLVEQAFKKVDLLDVSQAALSVTKSRLGELISYIQADLTNWMPAKKYQLAHDRAAFHFLTKRNDQLLYVKNVHQALAQSGVLILGTFSKNGDSKRCSALDVCQHDSSSIKALFEPFELIENFENTHRTPSGSEQLFSWFVLKKKLQ